MFGNLFPQGEEALPVFRRRFNELGIVMHVNNRYQPARKCLFDGPIHAAEKVRVNRVGGSGVRVCRPSHWNPHGIESVSRNKVEVFLLQCDAPCPFFRSIQCVAQIYTALGQRVPVKSVRSAHRLHHIEKAAQECSKYN